MKKLLFALILLCWLTPSVAAQQDSAAASADNASQPASSAAKGASEAGDNVVEEIVARVNDAIITRDQLRRNAAQTEMDAQEMHLTPAEVAERRKNALRDLIDQQLLIQKAAELGINADAELIQRLDELRKQMKVGSMEELQKIAESQGVSWEEFKQNSKNGILAQKVISSEVGGRIQITQEDVKRYYEEHKEKFSQPARIRLSEILIEANPDALPGAFVDATEVQVDAAREKIAKIYDELKAGADFAEIAKTQSNGSTAAQGGDLGYFKHNDLAAQLEEMTFHLKVGEFTQPIQTRQGFIILLVTDQTTGGAPPLDRVSAQIRDLIYGERIQPALRTYLVKLRQDAYINVRPGYTDTGTVAPKSKVVYTKSSGPKTKEVSGPLGLGKKTVLVDESKTEAKKGSTSGIVSELDAARAKVASAQRALDNSTTPEARAKAQADFDAAEKVMLSHMSGREKKQYLKDKKKNAEKRAKHRLERKKDQKELAERKTRLQAAKDKLAAAQKALAESTTGKEADAAKRAVKKAEKEMLRQMSSREKDRYFREKREAEKRARRQREEAEKKEARKATEAKREDAKKSQTGSGDAGEKADASSTAPKKKKGFSWF